MLTELIQETVAKLLDGATMQDCHFLGGLVDAAIAGRRISVAALARNLPGGSQAYNEQRVREFCASFKFSSVGVAARLIAPFLTHDPESPLVLATDPTHLGHCWSITTAIVTRDRALPVLKTVIGRNQKVQKALRRHFQALRKAIPQSVKPLILADGAFGYPAMLRLLRDQLNFDFAVRFQPGICVRKLGADALDAEEIGKSFVAFGRIDAPYSQASDYGTVEFTVTDSIQVRVLKYWDPRFAQPWCIVTTLSCAVSAVVALYSFRFRIEHLFRDEKSQRYGFGLDSYAYNDAERMDVLQLVSTITYHLLVRAGRYAEYRQWKKYSERVPRQIALWRVGLNLLSDPERRDRIKTSSLEYIAPRIPQRVKALLKYSRPAPQSTWALTQKAEPTLPIDPPSNLPSLGERIRQLLSSKKLLHRQVAGALGVSQQRFGRVASCQCPVPASWLDTLAAVFDLTTAELTAGTSYRPPDPRVPLKLRPRLGCTTSKAKSMTTKGRATLN